ncbi:molybdopterin-dependent oxidoreductase [Marinihelvus fidelis]|uniref:Molybdopterin-dependent oxidoreductase n=1 Tax=Marinihelvus fidelis TaxID=2613842 RepID=A0A5N0TG63_9GAMM|nr:molybdopterin-dependent oxidoreductase [Marinihelvus fidelis]KAA9134153.1 molybdopterin-dependent oxidoreductase [Marinihelvus fidelis]
MSVLHRRTLLQAMALAGVGTALKPLALLASATPSVRPMPTGKLADWFILHNDRPWALETRRAAYGIAPITPQSAFFVRNNLPTPPESIIANRDGWRFEVSGVARPGSLTLAELKALPTRVVASVLQCSGNGRAFFPHRPSGSPWSLGAAGCALWTGVRVADVLEHFGGALEEAQYLTATGAEDLPEGVDADQVVVERSIPLDKGMDDCLLAWEMNGEPLPLVHGGPLRLIVPGYYGVNNVKWVRRLAPTAAESGAKIQVSGYRVREVGESGGPQHPSMWRMNVKSWLNGPGGDGGPVVAGKAMLYGVAFSGERGVSRVEVSADEGQTWREADFVGPDLGPNAWRSFVLPVELAAGEYRFVSRATDRQGDTQPADATPNHRGYGHNGWRDAALTVNVVNTLPAAAEPEPGESVHQNAVATPTAAVDTPLSPLAREGRAVYLDRAQPACGACHTLADAGSAGVTGPNLDVLKPGADRVRLAVEQGVGAMPAFDALLTETEIEALAAYVAEATR